MEWVFGDYRLNADRAELIGPEGPVHIERSPLNLLIHLIRNADRVVSRDELIEVVWNGRIVSEAAVSTAVKQARRAVGDTGSDQSVLRTVHGRGFRFVAPLADLGVPARPIAATTPAPSLAPGKPSLAVLRFLALDTSQLCINLASALPAELCSSLARLGWLHVIARASSFRFDPADATPEDVGAALNVRYMLGGVVEVMGENLKITVEISSIESGAHVWSDSFSASLGDIQMARQDIVASVISALDLAIATHEAQGARRLNANEFDAWAHFHLGLSHLYKFSQGDNRIAAQHFEAALALDPHFSRAHSGLSFTHWQTAFMNFGEDRKLLIGQAVDSVSRALDIDASDAFANFNMGRARWLEGDLDGMQVWLDRTLQINPNLAQAHYTKGLCHVLDGAAQDSLTATEMAMALSPLDPLAYAMLCVQAMSHIRNENFSQARILVERATQLPGAHFYIAMIASATAELDGAREAAESWRLRALQQRPDANADMFFASFPFRDEHMLNTMGNALRRIGFT